MGERFKLALVAPDLKGDTPAAEYWRSLLPLLREDVDVETFVAAGKAREGETSIDEIHPRRYQQILYLVDDSRECGYMARAIRAIGGTVDLFSWNLPAFALAAWPELERKGGRAFMRSLKEGGFSEALAWRRSRTLDGHCFNRSVVRHGDAFIVRDESLAQKIRDERNENTAIGALRHPSLTPVVQHDRGAARRALGLGDDWLEAPLVASFSPLHPHQWALLSDAVQELRDALPDVRVLAVDRSGRVKGGSLPRERVAVVDPDQTWSVLEAGDVAVHLPRDRNRATGEIQEALARGRRIVTTESAESDAPDQAVARVEATPKQVSEALSRFLNDSERRDSDERSAAQFMDEARRWKHAARLYTQWLAAFPAPRAARKSLIAARLREAERRTTTIDGAQ